MFYFLYELWPNDGYLNIFRYLTFRAAMGAITAFLFSVIAGKYIIGFLKSKNIKEQAEKKDSAKLAEMHASKSSTPTMGGVIILIGFTLSALLWGNLSNSMLWIILFGTIALGALGVVDDWMKLTILKSPGMSAKMKMLILLMVGLCVFLAYAYTQPNTSTAASKIITFDFSFLYSGLINNHTTVVQFPFNKEWIIDIGWFYLPFFIMTLVGASNAVNLTDGLDGLATGCMIFVTLTYLIIVYLCGHKEFAQYLNIMHIVNAGELTVLCAIIMGSCLGFLWYNSFPAQVFMGDTGSLALGGFIGMVALFSKHEIILILAGGIFVVEALSVIIQVSVFKRTQKRVFKCAPLHHHFQFLGMPETKIVARFWIVGIVFALLALATIKIR